MSALRFTRRGHPLVFLGVLLLGWLGLRVATWNSPFELAERLEDAAGAPIKNAREAIFGNSAALRQDDGQTGDDGLPETSPSTSPSTLPSTLDAAPAREQGWPALDQPLPGLLPTTLAPAAPAPRGPARAGLAPPAAGASSVTGMAIGHALLAMMGLSQMQVPPVLAALLDIGRRSGRGERASRLAQDDAATSPVPPVRLASGTAAPRRWSADGWVLVRDGGERSSAPGQPSYGRSQAGAVLRYRLAPSSGHAPQAYVRASSALGTPRDAEVATGLSGRPLPRVPVRVAAEVRLADAGNGTDVRPAAYAVTEFPPFALPLGARGEVYAQAGYVGGDFATPFVDGQARVTRDVTRVGRATFSGGAGVWGGAQEGAARLDVGPSVALSFGIGQVYSRLSVDYRVRVAGDAAPASGPALTLAAGF